MSRSWEGKKTVEKREQERGRPAQYETRAREEAGRKEKAR